MSVATESEILRATGTFVTNAVANTAQSDALIAAPGANLRLRIYWVSFTWVITAAIPPPAAASTIIGRCVQASVTIAFEYPAAPWAHWFMPQGAPLSVNTALTMVEAASAAALNYFFGVGYVIESV